jgi:hypothetical protein
MNKILMFFILGFASIVIFTMLVIRSVSFLMGKGFWFEEYKKNLQGTNIKMELL